MFFPAYQVVIEKKRSLEFQNNFNITQKSRKIKSQNIKQHQMQGLLPNQYYLI